jgi:hypothetical protein
MNRKLQARVLVTQYRMLQKEFQVTLALYAGHYKMHGKYPANVVELFRTYSERGKDILLALQTLNEQLKAPVIDMTKIEIPDHLPEEL